MLPLLALANATRLGSSRSMTAAVYRGRGFVQLERVPVPHPGSREVLIRVRRCGLCPTDIKKIAMGLQPPPRVYGHEIAGVVAATGQEVEAWQVGDRVVAFHHIPCGSCHYCRHGAFAQCSTYRQTGTVAAFEPAGGGFAEYVLVRDWIVAKGMVRLPDDIAYDEASLLEPLATCLKAVRRCALDADCVAAVLGQGPVGLMLTALLADAGVRVVAVEPREDRATKAREFGASDVFPPTSDELAVRILEMTDGRGADAVILAIPASAGIEEAMHIVRSGGTVLLFADTHLGDHVRVDAGRICSQEVSIIGSYSSDVTLQDEAARLLFARPAFWRSLVSHVLPLVEIEAAINLALNPPPGALKILVAP